MTTSRARCERLGLAAVGVAAVVALGGCAGGAAAGATGSGSPTYGVTASQPTEKVTPGTAGSGSNDLPAPTTWKPIKRNGKTAKPTQKAKPGTFGAAHAVAYPDGLTVAVSRAATTKEPDTQGPGMFPGRHLVVVDLTLTNGTSASVDLGQVVVTLAYGKPAKIAQPTYNTTGLSDFSGVVKPGAKSTARYAFAVPAAKDGQLTAVVDFSADHYPAVLTGSAS